MKKLIFVLIFSVFFCIGITAYASDDVFKISMDGEVKHAKDINSGKGISIVLPKLEDENFYISAVELAVFEKRVDDTEYHIYKNDNGEESKKQFIENPAGYQVQIEFGNAADYREQAKYKIAYRYYVVNKHDTSVVRVAGETEKDGWRLIGERDPKTATSTGFTFYKNSNPTLSIECFSYTKHTVDGDISEACNAKDVATTIFPSDLFTNGLTVHVLTNDFDTEDTLTTHYVLKNHETGEIVSEGPFQSGHIITAPNVNCSSFSLNLYVTDGFGGTAESEEYVFSLDNCPAYVTQEFDDGGYWLKGETLFSDFCINDDENVVMTEGSVKARILLNGEEYSVAILSKQSDGVYRLQEHNMPDGKYTVELTLFDKTGNISTHTFYQNLDNTAPAGKFLTTEEHGGATQYSVWTNLYKSIMVDITDDDAGVRNATLYRGQYYSGSYTFGGKNKSERYTYRIPSNITGKITYTIYLYDMAKEIDVTGNKYAKSNGNSSSYTKAVWIDRTPPTIEAEHNETVWHEAPYMFYANFYDFPSSSKVKDASGVKEKLYAITEGKDDSIGTWNVYTYSISFPTGGEWYVHLKAVDYAGNETMTTCKVKVNTMSELIGTVKPTDDYTHTIYYSEPEFYVVKNTAYNTKYHFSLYDEDLSDIIKTSVKLVSCDDNTICATSEVLTYPTETTIRDIVFNMPYTQSSGDTLPDGVYTMYLTVQEQKPDEAYVSAFSNVPVCQVVIKRNAPPTPVISVSDGTVSIDYPEEELSGSLNTEKVRNLYRKQYKMVIEGDGASNVYVPYTTPFATKKSIVTALYTDIAGNISTTTKRIYGTVDATEEDDRNILEDGNTTVVEEARSANVYYIGIRREKTNGIDGDIFQFME